MINIVFSVMKLCVLFLGYFLVVCLEYIEFVDAFVLGFLTWLVATTMLPISSEMGIVFGAVIGVGFLLLFKTRIGWWIATPVFSFMWASTVGWIVDGLLHVSSFWHWIVVGGCFLYFAWLHRYASYRKEIGEELAAEEAAARNLRMEIENREAEEAQRRMDAFSMEMKKTAEERQRTRN